MERCPECGTEIDSESLNGTGIITCSICQTPLARDADQALTVVDDIPEDEYLGG